MTRRQANEAAPRSGGPGSGPQPGGGSHADDIEGTQAEADKEVKQAADKVKAIRKKLDEHIAKNPSNVLKKLPKEHQKAAEKVTALASEVGQINSRIAELKQQLAASRGRQGGGSQK